MTTTANHRADGHHSPDPLDMANNCVSHVLAYADAQEADPVQGYVHQLGVRGHQAAELAGHMALVSIAKARVFRVPNFLGAALMLSLLGVLLLFVSGGM